ncbi:nuclear transport factor 2 family protein [Nesterenkonia haasae]|uniref:nuclear transport factor 2 family protein n=1 Tax=Nesterenkonia haasae TaxID=2587813 RepID=UPI001390DAE1|nr:nuclear transport factor 2 family protein [Nesterenkonia haasae]NDK31952.1 nuclear transport factor 2 family protein [Nesterenkonia haasae]
MTDMNEALLERLEYLEKCLHELTSAQDIQKLQQKYFRDLAERNWDGVAEAYAEDAVCDIRQHGPHQGKEEIATMFSTELEPVVKSRDGYMLSSPDITVDGDTAYGEFVWHRFVCEFRTSFGMMRIWGPWSEGIYKVHYRRIDGVWKIQDLWTRVVRPDHDDDVAAMPEGAVIGGGYQPSQER